MEKPKNLQARELRRGMRVGGGVQDRGEYSGEMGQL